MSACVEWWGHVSRSGYGIKSDGKYRNVLAHRHIWAECFGEPIPPVLHHACRNKSCVNPAHLEATDNETHDDSAPAWQRGKTQCAHGHPFDERNTVWLKRGGRGCRACRRESARRNR